MSKKLKGTLLGIAASFVGVILFVILVVGLELIAGVAGALTGMLFFIVYKKVNYEDTTIKYATVGSIIVTIVQVIFASYISYALLAAKYDLTFKTIMENSEISAYFYRDLIVGLLLSFVCLLFYILDQKKKGKFISPSAVSSIPDSNESPEQPENNE